MSVGNYATSLAASEPFVAICNNLRWQGVLRVRTLPGTDGVESDKCLDSGEGLSVKASSRPLAL